MNRNQINQIKALKGVISDTDIRKEIRKLGYKKTAANNWFNRIFQKTSTGLASTTQSELSLECDDSMCGCMDIKMVEAPNSSIKTLQDLIEVCEIDTDIWECVKFIGNSYGENFQAKGEFRRKVTSNIETIIKNLKEDMKQYSPKVNDFKYKPLKEGKLLVIGIMDAHLGRLSSTSEVGHNYDIKIAREIYFNTLNDLVHKATKQGNIERILYVVGNDFLTVDGETLKTTAGTEQDTDGRFPKIFREGRKLLVETIEILTGIAPVDVVTVFGNHERSSMFHLGDALQCWFRNDKNVNVENSEKLRKYYTYKDVIIGTTHGDTIKHDKLVTMGLVDVGEKWGKAKRRFWLLGHTHHLKCVNLQGVELWTFPSICGSDRYHQANGYVGSTRSGLAMIFSKDNLEAVFQSQPIEDTDYQ
jgi:hypothetical protein